MVIQFCIGVTNEVVPEEGGGAARRREEKGERVRPSSVALAKAEKPQSSVFGCGIVCTMYNANDASQRSTLAALS